ncbi:hypothetical protein RJ639_036603, partial [Escallonia herrerae]
VWDLWREGRALEVADPSLGESYPAHEVLRCIHIRLLLFSNLSLQACETECLKSCNCTGYASSDVNNGGRGCFAWYGQLNDLRQYDKDGQDFYLRVAAAELVANTTRNSKGIRGTKKILIITLPIVAAALLLVCCSLYLWRVHAKRKDQREKRIHRERVLHDSTTMPNKDFPGANNRGESRNIELKFFDLETIITATDDFSAAKKIGQGGFGPVYKLRLLEGCELVILYHSCPFGNCNLLNPCSGYMSPEYALDGLFSIKSDVFSFGVLLLEVISGKKNIGFFHNNPTSNLIKHAWELWNDGNALELVDACMGDSYPTRDVLRCIQVGLLCVQDEATDRPDMSTIVFMLSNETTLPSPKQPLFSIQSDSNPSGYMSPEYALDGLFSEKSDVFSFGVLLLEVISGRKNIGFFRQDPDSNLMRYAWDLWNSNRALELVDSSMGDAYPADEVMRCIQIGLLCVQDQAIDRPTMLSIVFMLCNEKALPSPKQPVFAVKTGQSNRSKVDSVSTGTKSSVNEVTFTMLDAR